jgi:Cu-processing system permease protein
VTHVRTIAAFTIREALRRRVFVVVALLSVAFLGLYSLGTWQAFKAAEEFDVNGVSGPIVAGATLFGLSMFGTLFLGVVLAIFLTLGAVRGDADRGLLQPMLVRSVSRRDLLAGRLAAAAAVCTAYVLVLYFTAMIITGAMGGWWPDHIVTPGLQLALGTVIIAALSLGGSVVLASTANGIATFMVFGAGLVAGLLGQIGEGLGSETLQDVSSVASWLLPFEALYQDALAALTSDTVGATRFVIQLGPLGGADSAGPGLWLWALVYLALVGAAALASFNRADL